METPEKIYLQEPTKVRTGKKYDNDVEYIRTDVFIEKAEKWLDEHIFDYVYAKKWGQGVGIEGELFDDFRNAMKGE